MLILSYKTYVQMFCPSSRFHACHLSITPKRKQRSLYNEPMANFALGNVPQQSLAFG